jgi:hypothetical protein
MKSMTPPMPPTRARLPTAAEMDDMAGRAFMEAARELREEDEHRTTIDPAIYGGVWTNDLDAVMRWTWIEHWETERERRKANELREAIRLGVRLAEEEALFKLTMRARQVRAAELGRRRPHLVVDNTTLH